jgi:hypothetical protein
MAASLFMNSVVGLVAGTPNNSSSYIMATNEDPRIVKDTLLFDADYIILGGGNKMNRLKAPPQAESKLMVGAQDITAGGNVVAWTMAVSRDPRSSAGWALKGNRRGNRKCNYPPQIGA